MADEFKIPEKVYDESGTDISASLKSHQSELETKLTEAQKKAEDIEKKSYSKTYNFAKLREMNEDLKKAVESKNEDLKKELEKDISKHYTEKEQALLQEIDGLKGEVRTSKEARIADVKANELKSYAGDNEEVAKKIMEEYNALKDKDDTESEIKVKMRRSALLAGVQIKSEEISRGHSSGGGWDSLPAGATRYTDTEEGKKNFENWFPKKS